MPSSTINIIRVFFTSFIDFFDSITVPGLNITFFELFIGILGFTAIVAFFKALFSIGVTNISLRKNSNNRSEKRGKDNG